MVYCIILNEFIDSHICFGCPMKKYCYFPTSTVITANVTTDTSDTSDC